MCNIPTERESEISWTGCGLLWRWTMWQCEEKENWFTEMGIENDNEFKKMGELETIVWAGNHIK